MDTIVQLLSAFLQIYVLCVFAWVLLSWLPMISPGLAFNSTVTTARQFLDSVVLPYVRLFKFIPPIRLGATMLDVSVIVAIIVLQIGGNLVIGLLSSSVG